MMGVGVEIKVLKDKRIRIHWFVDDDKGPIRTAQSDPIVHPGLGTVVLGGAVGYIACQPTRQTLTSPIVNGRLQPCPCSREITAVTCPECKATKEFQAATDAAAKHLTEEI